MPSARPTFVVPKDAVAETSLHALASTCSAQLEAGDRLVTLFGRPDADEDVLVTAVLLSASGRLTALRARARKGERYPALTPKHPRAHMLERELWEQTGVLPSEHPWLKPVRFEGARQEHMHEYPFFSLQGKEVHEVGVGPIHAGVIEPGHFRFMCLGEMVHHLEVQLGYQHRGVEKLLLERDPRRLGPLIETVAGDSSVAHAWAYCAALEALAEAPASLPVEAVRGVALELERIAMHLAGLAGLATDIAFLQGATSYGRLRTAIINASMRVSGSRFGRGLLRPGGVVSGLSHALRDDLKATLHAFSRDFREVTDLMVESKTVQSRFRGVGVVKKVAAQEVGLLGPSARASGVPLDLRSVLRGSLWDAFGVDPRTEETGDCWARMKLRMAEITESVRWIMAVLDSANLPLEVEPASLPTTLRENALCVSLCEGWRGEVTHVLETAEGGRLCHYKLQDPSLHNWFGLALALRETEISDFPICNKSFDLSYCGNDL